MLLNISFSSYIFEIGINPKLNEFHDVRLETFAGILNTARNQVMKKERKKEAVEWMNRRTKNKTELRGQVIKRPFLSKEECPLNVVTARERERATQINPESG